jgi:hypothetical protein
MAAIIAANDSGAAPGWQADAVGVVQHFMTPCFESKTVKQAGDKLCWKSGDFCLI